MNVALFLTLTIDAISIITKTEASPFWGWSGKSKAKHWNGYQNKKNPICSSGQCVLAWKCPEDAIFRESTGSCTYWTNGPWVCCDMTTIQERSPKSTLSSNPSTDAPGGYSKQATKTSWKQKTITESYVYNRKERLSTPCSESSWTRKARPTPISSVGDIPDSERERSISSRPVNNPTKIPLNGVRKTTIDSYSQRLTRISSTRATRHKTHTSEFRIVFPTESAGWTQKVTKRPASNTHTSKKTSDYKPATKTWSTHRTTKVAWRPSTRLPGRTKSTTTIKPAASTRTWIRPTSNSGETKNQGRATATPAQDHIPNSRTPSSSVRTTSRYRSTTPLPNVNTYMCGIRDKRPLTNRQRRDDYNPDVDIIHSEPRNSNRKPYQRIVGGEEAKPFSWPWVAALYKVAESGGHRFLSAGSLINENFVLTAAHVFTPEDLRTASYVVMLGTHDAQNAVAEYSVSSVMLHPNYEHRFYYHDIALMSLEKPVAFNGYVMPVCLPSPNAPLLRDRDLEGKNVTVMGWGDDSFGGKSSRVLKEATFPIVSRSSCNASYVRVASNRFPRGITEEMLCAGDPNGGKDACQGDSGGPLTSVERGRHTQVGIVSFGYQCGDRDFPGVYTKVAPYLSWIAENTKDYIKNYDYRG